MKKLIFCSTIMLLFAVNLFSLNATATVPPGWFFSNTGNNHILLIQNGIPITINGNQISMGDYIGVFYDSLGTLACAGYVEWQGGTVAITAWGAQSGATDGFAINEEFKWKIYDVSEGVEFDAKADYDTMAFTQAGYYQVNGLSGVLSLTCNSGPDWSFVNSGDIHLLLIATSSPVTIDGVPIANGDFVGVFYDSVGTLACAGYEEWTGQNIAVTAWGDDVLTSAPDGFLTGETFKWKIWKASSNTVLNATASYMSPPLFPNMGAYNSNGISSITSLEAFTIEYQYIELAQGWSMFSSYINPFEPNIDSICAPFYSSVIIVKDDNGNTSWPSFGVNTIGDMVLGEGYRIKLASAQTMIVTGLSVQPEITPLVLQQGWCFLGYLRKNSAPIANMLSPIAPGFILAVNGEGQTYWPQWLINTIGNMNPGEGYQIKMFSQQVLTYPPN